MQSIIRELPQSAGVYQYFDCNDKLLYIGKAKNLRNRVKSYWRFTPKLMPNPSQSPRILKMLDEVVRLEYIVVGNEKDALILENSLIKQLKPKYNILLRDDKTYPYIYIDNSLPFPRFEITRKAIKGKNITYYGPFPTGSKSLFDGLYEVYPLVQNRSCLKGKKACLFYQIKKCLAPCEEKITQEEYADIIEEAKVAIIKRKPLISALTLKMATLASQERYEEAGAFRDMISDISSLTLSSDIDLANSLNIDIWAIQNGDERGVVVKLFMRNGKIISSDYSYFRHTHIFDENEAYRQALLDFYHKDSPNINQNIIVAHKFEDMTSINETLSEIFKKKIEITHPKIGAKAKLISLALQNADELLRKSDSTNNTIMEQRVADLFSLLAIPYRVESFDNSHLMGVATVGGMVVWDEDSWDKSSYRRYQLHERDEYGQMREMLSRRIAKFTQNPPPDLWILDGGKANLHLAQSLLQEANVNLDVIAIAKEKIDSKAHRAKGSARDIIHTHDEVFELRANDKRLMWIQRQRDESHRYAIAYHQNKKRKDDRQISLLNKKGIGKATVKKLIDYFGTFEAIAKSSIEEIAKVTNSKIADIIKNTNL
ncbi:MAG: excinuclease ABC subunit UvrC [Sulfurovum sp.]